MSAELFFALAFEIIRLFFRPVIIGWIASQLVHKRDWGFWTSFSIGCLGAIFGKWLLPIFDLDFGEFVNAIIGAVISLNL